MKKKIISLLLTIAIILCAAAVPMAVSATGDSGYILGDADGNGEVEVIDATFVQRSATKVKVSIPDIILMHGDIDGDGDLSVVDATFIQRHCTRVATPYPIGEFVKIEDPTEPEYINPTFVVDKLTANAGDIVTVAVNVKNNPGILGMTLTLSYDNKALTLTNAVCGNAVSDVLSFTKPGRYSNPCNFTWDGIEISDNQIKDGVILILTFTVSSNASDGVYPIVLSYEEDNIFDKVLMPVNFDIVNGSVTVGNAVVDPTIVPTQPGTEDPVAAPVFTVEDVIAYAGQTVTVAVNVKNNPGILGMTLTLSYDSNAMTLTNAVSGSAVNDVLAFTKPGRFTNPCNFTWDGIELNDDQIKDGELLVLTFNVASTAAKWKYPITLSYDEDSIFNAELQPVNFTVVNGSVTVK